ncbi:type II pantothenate kinase [Neobacillus ginsengisoli]|uniref:Type II pantothenate kinase n=1 Tax=Neobacillus ginsengisoli TaxID=904295 RepID=A0ABT9XW06_9BACI|nr:type II pantothenate kinase [Neobacillus ginsengisoli]MDQ0199742.1 type II pantothenate kinase [Neobacillus ginsengisoli]
MKAGIDAGGTLIKIAYLENHQMHYKKFSIEELDTAISWLKLVAPSVTVALTGGKSHIIQKKYFPRGVIIPEFQATCDGARLFLLEENKKIENPFLLVNIGTGTSWHVVNGDTYERILGSGVGGGTFTGLGTILTEEEDFHQLTILANEGEKGNVDLLVRDIYEMAEPPIDGNLTAANFAKGRNVKHTDSDRMASLTNMIAETVVLLTLQAGAIHRINNVIYIGSTLVGNQSLKKNLELYTGMFGLTSRFLQNGEFCGAAGACFSV